jgi:hypothetical protein
VYFRHSGLGIICQNPDFKSMVEKLSILLDQFDQCIPAYLSLRACPPLSVD